MKNTRLEGTNTKPVLPTAEPRNGGVKESLPADPDMVFRRQHEQKDTCVRFFGTHDFGWINRRRIYLYHEGDSDIVAAGSILGTGGQTDSHQALGSGRASRDRVREVINNEELPRRINQKDENYYFLTVDSELTIDAGPKGNLARFINYSCESNCETLLWKVGGSQSVGLFALKDLKAG
ncbi:hypothetical protein pipiens_017902 [Culex pipiens pipiens]|uniref:SET domain-containing protein n=1 Tax=Culex pipiens pipiens TaxID=38569 RepID=A0ABD1CEF9_CULPP